MKYYLHDANSFHDEKIYRLFMEHGYEGLGLFYTFLEKIAQQEKPINENVVIKQLNIGKKLLKVWDFMKEIDLVSSKNGDCFNDNLLNFAESYQIKKEKTRIKVSEWREKQKDTENVTDYVPVSNPPKVKLSKVNKVNKNKEFYDKELISSNNNPKYSYLIDFLFGKNPTGGELTPLLQLEQQISYNNFVKLYEKAEKKEVKLSETILTLYNTPKYYNGHKSLYLTLNTWLNRK